MNPAHRSFGEEKQSVFDRLVDKYHAEFLVKSQEELAVEINSARENYRIYHEKRQRRVGTSTSRKVAGSGSLIVFAPTGRPNKQKRLIKEYDDANLDKIIPILARLDAAELILKERSESEN